MASKIYHTKDWSFGIQFETFPKAMKNSDIKVYKNGFHHWIDSGGCNFYAMVIHRFRFIVWKQSKHYGCCNAGRDSKRKARLEEVAFWRSKSDIEPYKEEKK